MAGLVGRLPSFYPRARPVHCEHTAAAAPSSGRLRLHSGPSVLGVRSGESSTRSTSSTSSCGSGVAHHTWLGGHALLSARPGSLHMQRRAVRGPVGVGAQLSCSASSVSSGQSSARHAGRELAQFHATTGRHNGAGASSTVVELGRQPQVTKSTCPFFVFSFLVHFHI